MVAWVGVALHGVTHGVPQQRSNPLIEPALSSELPTSRFSVSTKEDACVSFAGDPRAVAASRRLLQAALPLRVLAISPSSAPAHFVAKLNREWPAANGLHTLNQVHLMAARDVHEQLDCLDKHELRRLGAGADLLLLEPPALSGPSYWRDIVAVERVLRLLARSMKEASVILAHGLRVWHRGTSVEGGIGTGIGTSAHWTQRSLAQAWLNSSELPLALLSQFYGVPQLSLRYLLRSGLGCGDHDGTAFDFKLAECASTFLTHRLDRGSRGRTQKGEAAGGSTSWATCGAGTGLCSGWLPVRSMLARPVLRAANSSHGPTPQHASHGYDGVNGPTRSELRQAREAEMLYTAPPRAAWCPRPGTGAMIGSDAESDSLTGQLTGRRDLSTSLPSTPPGEAATAAATPVATTMGGEEEWVRGRRGMGLLGPCQGFRAEELKASRNLRGQHPSPPAMVEWSGSVFILLRVLLATDCLPLTTQHWLLAATDCPQHRLLATACSTTDCPTLTACCVLATIYYLVTTRRSPSTIYYLLSTIYYLLSTIYYRLSTIHRPLPRTTHRSLRSGVVLCHPPPPKRGERSDADANEDARGQPGRMGPDRAEIGRWRAPLSRGARRLDVAPGRGGVMVGAKCVTLSKAYYLVGLQPTARTRDAASPLRRGGRALAAWQPSYQCVSAFA